MQDSSRIAVYSTSFNTITNFPFKVLVENLF